MKSICDSTGHLGFMTEVCLKGGIAFCKIVSVASLGANPSTSCLQLVAHIQILSQMPQF